MIGVSVGQHHMRDDRVVAEMVPDVRNERFARVQISAVDDHQLVRRSIAVADDDCISGAGSVPDREKLNFAIHLRRISARFRCAGCVEYRALPSLAYAPLSAPLGQSPFLVRGGRPTPHVVLRLELVPDAERTPALTGRD